MVRARLKLLLLVCALPSLAIFVRLAWLQLHPATHRHYHKLSEHRRNIFSAPMRGRIFSRDGQPLAGNRPVYRLTFHYPSLNPRAEPLQAIVDELQKRFPFFDMAATDSRLVELASPRELAAESPGAPSRVPEWIPFIKGLDSACAASLERRLKKHDKDKKLFELRPSPRRGLSDLHFNPRRAAAMEIALHRLAPLISRGEPPGRAYEALRGKVASELDRLRFEVEKDVKRECDENEVEPNIRVKTAREAYIRAMMRTSRRIHLANSWVLAADVPPGAVTEVEYHPELYPGIQVEDGIRRIYPLGEVAGTLTGYLGKLLGREAEYRDSNKLIDALRGIDGAAFEEARDGSLRSTDLTGTGGIEERYDAELRGLYGLRVVSVDMIHQPKDLLEDLRPRHGEDIRTTIDASLQTAVYEALRDGRRPDDGPLGGIAASAAVMSLDPSETGALLASAGFPGVDPNRLTEATDAYLQELESVWGEKSNSWLFDRPSRLPLYPGSIFKIVVAAAALESASPRQGIPYDPAFRYECRGEFHIPNGGSISCNAQGGHGPLDLPASLGRSCNSYFYYLGLERLDAKRLHHWGDQFGFGSSPEIDLAGPGSPGRLFGKDDLEIGKRGLCEYSIGQTFVQATPLQVLRCVAAIALKGASLPRPYVVRPSAPAKTIRLEDPRAWEVIRDGLWRAGHEAGGTAARPELGLHRYNAAYKTGTAEVGPKSGKLHQAWIAGFAPFDRPRIAFVAVVERTPLHGDEACAPIVRRILEHFARSDPGAYLIEGEPRAISGAEAPAR